MSDKKSKESGEITKLLLDWSNGDKEALSKIMPLVYDTLKRIAYGTVEKWSQTATSQIQPTVLVHEAYIRLIDQNKVSWQNRSHFFVIAAREIRRILIDEYRKRQTDKRGGQLKHVSLNEAIILQTEQNLELLALDQALEELFLLDPRQARILDLYFFGGHSSQEIAEIEQLGLSTIERELTYAKRWLKNRLNQKKV